MNTRSTPTRIGQAHHADETANFAGLRRSSLGSSAFPGPIQSKPFTIPGNDSVRFHDPDTRAPALPQTRQPDPEDAIDCMKLCSPTLSRTLEHEKLMAQGQNFSMQLGTRAQ